jgi:hypothetical protein
MQTLQPSARSGACGRRAESICQPYVCEPSVLMSKRGEPWYISGVDSPGSAPLNLVVCGVVDVCAGAPVFEVNCRVVAGQVGATFR